MENSAPVNNGSEDKKINKWKNIVRRTMINVSILLCIIVLALGGYVYNNLNYYKAPLKKTMKVGFEEKQVTLDDGTTLNYAEGPDNGPALLLIHGQTVSWEDYAKVLPKLSKYYHIFAIDCHGHGESSVNPEKYRAQAMGRDFVWFIQNVIGEPVVVSGHSSGGLLTAWLAANSPENVRGVVLEDPPFFSCELDRCEKTFAWVDSFEPIHRYFKKDEQGDFILYYLENCHWLTFFGNGRDGILKYARSYRQKHPDDKFQIFYLPPSINRLFHFMDTYDPRFGEMFYDCSWLENYDHAETLSRIDCPSVLIHASWKYDENGILLAAMDDKDAKRAHSLIKGNEMIDIESGHDVHYEKPDEFIKVMIDFLDTIEDK